MATPLMQFQAGHGLAVEMTLGATAVSAGDPLKISAGLLVPVSGAGDEVFGVACVDGAANAVIAVYVGSGDRFKGTAGGTLVAGDKVWVGAAGTLVKTGQASGEKSIGTMIEGGASSARLDFIAHFAASQQALHP